METTGEKIAALGFETQAAYATNFKQNNTIIAISRIMQSLPVDVILIAAVCVPLALQLGGASW